MNMIYLEFMLMIAIGIYVLCAICIGFVEAGKNDFIFVSNSTEADIEILSLLDFGPDYLKGKIFDMRGKGDINPELLDRILSFNVTIVCD